ncbi:hypothetical protein, partial [Bartonella sp. CL63NXGY]|uniref:hypothetical protein n=1 Tax=Bartonella sp. CL63NXGY TaxID=3243538 RepID=UPI0035D1360E
NGQDVVLPSNVDLTGYLTKIDADNIYAKKSEIPVTPDLSSYATKAELDGYAKTSDLPDLSGYAKMGDIPSVTGLVKETELDNYAKKSELPDLSNYALKSELPTVPDLSGYAKKSDIPAVPDTSNFVDKTTLADYATNASVDEKIKDIKPSEDSSVKGLITTDYGTFLLHRPTSFSVANANAYDQNQQVFVFDNGAEIHWSGTWGPIVLGGQEHYWDSNNGKVNGSPANGLIWQYMLGNFGITVH